MTSDIPRMDYRQYRAARRLVHECCNYEDGNCILLDDGEPCVCVQSISYSLLCRWFRIAVLPLDKELETAEKRIGELSAIFKRLYEDSVAGRISDERFMELSADYEAEQKELKERAAALQAELSKALEATENAGKFMKIVRRNTNFEELTPTLLREFVEKIIVHETVALDGKRKIFYISVTSLSHTSKNSCHLILRICTFYIF